MYESPESV